MKKKFIWALALTGSVFFFPSCHKNSNNNFQNQSVQTDAYGKNGQDLAKIIDKIAAQDIPANTKTGVLQIKHPGMTAAADAVGGAIAGGTATWSGIGLIFAPYAVAWGAFWFSMGVAQLDMVAPPQGGFTNPTVPSVLQYSYMGQLHNDLCVGVYQNNEFPLLTSTGSLNPLINTRILNANYNQFPTTTPRNLQNFYNSNTQNMINEVNGAPAVETGGVNQLITMINQSTLSADVKPVMIQVVNNVCNTTNTNLQSFTTYFQSVETSTNRSSLSSDDKELVKEFLGIFHHSLYLWSLN